MSNASGHELSRYLLFVVDDDAVWRFLVVSALRERGFEVVEFDSAAALLDELAVRRPDLAVIDALMPGFDGFELCRRIRAAKALSELPVLMMTSLDDESSISQAYEAGASDFFIKSTHWTLLAERIRQMLRRGDRSGARIAPTNDMVDELTGLSTRRGFIGSLGLLEDGNPAADGEQILVAVLDIDRFRSVNESLGLKMGDELIALVASRLNGAGPRLAARLLGDKFALAFGCRVGDEAIESVVRRLRELMTYPFEVSGTECFLSVSIGLAVRPDDGADSAELLARAESALGEAKRKGRNQVMRFVPREAASGRRRLDLNNALHRAHERGEISLHYQPVLDCRGSGSWSVEALMRWRHDGQWIPPVEFIPIAEETGLIIPLGEWAIAEALRQLSRWRAQGFRLGSVAVNVPPMHLGRGSLEAAIRAALSRYRLTGSSLVIELTESALMEDFDQALAQLRALHALGVHIAIDDFGTGYSSLSRLTRLPIGTLKVDRTFVHQMGVSREDTAVVKAIVSLASGLGIDVIAEGVETEEQLSRLREIGCMRFQGYLFSRPRPPEQVADMARLMEERYPLLCVNPRADLILNRD